MRKTNCKSERLEDNCYTLTTTFPKNLFFTEIVYVDNKVKTSLDLMEKYGIRYFKCHDVMYHPDKNNVVLVFATIKNNEIPKWKNVMKDLRILCPNSEYQDTIIFLEETFKDKIVKE